MNKKLTVRDLITVGIFAAMYFILTGLATFVMMMLFQSGGHFFLPVAVALVAGPIFFLALQKVPKFGVITILSGVMGLFFMVGGYFPLAFVPSFVLGFVADWILNKTNMTKKTRELVSYVIFCFSIYGPILPMVFTQQQYMDMLLKNGKDQAYIDKVFSVVSPGMFVLLIVLTILAGVIGAFIGRQFVEKNFAKR